MLQYENWSSGFPSDARLERHGSAKAIEIAA
jgi:hypothetical protein